MNSFVLNTIVKDCWNSTGKYFAVSVKPTRVSRAGGSLHPTRIARRLVSPPKTQILEPFFHYYQIGDIEPFLFGVKKFIKDEWQTIEQLMLNNEVFINVGFSNGIMLSPKDCWLKKAGIDRNWILAVYVNPMFNYGSDSMSFFLRQEENDSLVTYEDGSPIPLGNLPPSAIGIDDTILNIHFYTNPAYFNGSGRLSNAKVVSYKTNNPGTTAQALAFLNTFPDDLSTGWVLYNGMTSTLAYAKANAAGLAQKEIAVYTDETIVKKLFFKVTDIPYHYLDFSTGLTLRLGDTGFYNVDDISLFLGVGHDDTFKGLNLDFDLNRYVYQLSNVEVGLDAIAIGKLRLKYTELSDLSSLYVYAVVRKNVIKTPTINAARLDLISGLSIDERNKVFNGVYPALNYWRGQELKTNPFLTLSQAKLDTVQDDLVVNAYGYSGVNRLFNPYPVIASVHEKYGITTQTFHAGHGLKEMTPKTLGSFKIEAMVYDVTGKLIRSQFFDYDLSGHVMFQDLPPTKCAELTLTKGYTNKVSYFKKLSGNVTLDEFADAFGFACYVATSVAVGDWSLAEKGVHYNIVTTAGVKSVQWVDAYLTANSLVGRTVIGGDHFHSIVPMVTLTNNRDYGIITIQPDDDAQLGISPATIDIYRKGLLLIEGNDYSFAKDKIYIYSVGGVNDPIRTRLCGLSPTGQRLAPIDVGFTDAGQIGLGSKTRQMGYKQCQFNIGGLIYKPDEILLGGSGTTSDFIGTGIPYCVKQRVASIEHYVDYSSVDAMTEEENVSSVNYDALQAVYPLDSTRLIGEVTVDQKYQTISCFFNEVMYLVLAGWHFSEIQTEDYTVSDVTGWIISLVDLLSADICTRGDFNDEFLFVIPHPKDPITVSQPQLDFFTFVNENFLNGRVNLNGFFELG